MRHLGVGQGYLSFNVRIYFDETGARSDSRTLTGVRYIRYGEDIPRILRISMHGYDAMHHYSRIEQFQTSVSGFPSVSSSSSYGALEETDRDMGGTLAMLLFIPAMLEAVQSGSSDEAEVSPSEGRSGDKKVSHREAKSYLPREWLFGDKPISSPYR